MEEDKPYEDTKEGKLMDRLWYSLVGGVVAIVLLDGCTWDQHLAPIQQPTIATKPDPAAAVVAQCDRLGFSRYGEAHRLCVLRGIDRLATVPGPTTGYAPIQILPHAFPSMVAPGTITVVPLR